MHFDLTVQIVVNLCVPGWLQLLPGVSSALSPHLQLNFKRAVHWAATAVAAAVLLYCFATYRNYEKESYRWGGRAGLHVD